MGVSNPPNCGYRYVNFHCCAITWTTSALPGDHGACCYAMVSRAPGGFQIGDGPSPAPAPYDVFSS